MGEELKDYGTVDLVGVREVLRLMGKKDFGSLEVIIVEAVEEFKRSWKVESLPKNRLDDFIAAMMAAA